MTRPWRVDARPPLPPIQRQRLHGWVTMLDVDLELAQRMLRLPPAQMPLPPIALPPVTCDWTGEVVCPGVEAPTAAELAEEPTTTAPARKPLGAYARRARRG